MLPIPFLSSDTLVGIVGKPVQGGHPDQERVVSRLDSVGATRQVDRINVTGAANSSTYSVRFTSSTPGQVGRSYTVSVETDGDATQTELRDLIIAAIRATPDLAVLLQDVAAGSSIITVTWRPGGSGSIDFPANPSTHLTVTSISTTGTTAYLYGRFAEVLALPHMDASVQYQSAIRPVVEIHGDVLTLDVSATDDTEALTAVLLHTSAAGVTQQLTLSATAGASVDLTVAAIAAAADTLFDGTGAVVTGSADDDDVTIELPPGDSIAVISLTTGGTLGVTSSLELGDALPTYTFVRCDDWTPGASSPTGPVGATAVSTVDAGAGFHYAVEPPGVTPAVGAPVYVETAAGANRGRPYATPSPTRALARGARWQATDTADGVTVGVLEY